jgi:hypothetical protein
MIDFQDCSSFVFYRDSPFKFSSGTKRSLGCITKKNYNSWIKQDYLGKKEGLAAFDFINFRLPVFRRVAFDSVCNHPVLIRKSHVLDHFIQFLSCPSIEWDSSFVFTFSRRLSYEENFWITGPFSYNSPDGTFVERATCAFNNLSCNSLISCFHHHPYSLFKVSAVVFFICRRFLPPLIFYVVRDILKLYAHFCFRLLDIILNPSHET